MCVKERERVCLGVCVTVLDRRFQYLAWDEVFQELHGTLERMRLVVVVVFLLDSLHGFVERIGNVVRGLRDDSLLLLLMLLLLLKGQRIGVIEFGRNASWHRNCGRHWTGLFGVEHRGWGVCQMADVFGWLERLSFIGSRICGFVVAVCSWICSCILIEYCQLAGDGEISAGSSFAHRFLGAGRFQMVTTLVTFLVSAKHENNNKNSNDILNCEKKVKKLSSIKFLTYLIFNEIYLSGTSPSLPLTVPCHQSFDTCLRNVTWSPLRSESSRLDRALKSNWAVASIVSDSGYLYRVKKVIDII